MPRQQCPLRRLHLGLASDSKQSGDESRIGPDVWIFASRGTECPVGGFLVTSQLKIGDGAMRETTRAARITWAEAVGDIHGRDSLDGVAGSGEYEAQYMMRE